MPILPKPRPDLVALKAYRTQQGDAVARLNANEWAEPNPAGHWLTAAELDAVLLNRYPSAAVDLRAVLADRYGVSPEQVVVGNGSNEVLLNAFLAFGGHGRKTLLFQPTYSMYERLAIIAGGPVVNELVGFPYDLGQEQAVRATARVRPEIVVFNTPNNPTGNEIPFDTILAVADAYPETLILVDEAYGDFAGHTIVPELATHPNVVVTKTFSKVLAAAGLRVGILMAHPGIAEILRAVQLPYNVSALTHAVAMKIARNHALIAQRVAQCTRERERVARALMAVDSIEVHPSVTNFILFRLNEDEPTAVQTRLLEKGVLIRDVSKWPANEGCLRVSIGTPEENDRFIGAIGECLGAGGPA